LSEISRGEIWNADLDPVRGREQAGKRPVLVVSADPFNQGKSELVVILPITSKDKSIPTHVNIDPNRQTGLRTKSFIMCEAIRCVARERLAKFVGKIDDAAMAEVELRLKLLLNL
jgi:mRNA interferase MazF